MSAATALAGLLVSRTALPSNSSALTATAVLPKYLASRPYASAAILPAPPPLDPANSPDMLGVATCVGRKGLGLVEPASG